MAITLVQSTSDHGGADTSPHQDWKAVPTVGNLLVAVVTASLSGGSVTSTMSGWKLAADSANTTKVRQWIYYKVATATEKTRATATLSAARYWNILLVEANSSAPSGWVLDRSATALGTGTSPVTGTTLVTTTSEEFWVGGIGSSNKATLSSPGNGFTLTEQQVSSSLSGVLLTKIVAASAAAQSSGTFDTGASYVGTIATFMAQPQTIEMAGATMVGEGLMSAHFNYAEPTLLVQAAFGYGSAEPNPVWTDISSYVRSCNWQRGRQNELNEIQAGTATVILNDQYSDFDPSNTLSPFYPNVKPGLPVRAMLFVGASLYPLFYGFVERLPRTERVTDVYTQRQIDLTDGFALLANAGLGGNTYGEETSDERVNHVANDIAWPEAARRIGVGASTLQEIAYKDEDDTRAQTHFQGVADSENGLLYVDGANDLVFVGRHELLTDDLYTVPKASFGDLAIAPPGPTGWGAGGWGAGLWGGGP